MTKPLVPPGVKPPQPLISVKAGHRSHTNFEDIVKWSREHGGTADSPGWWKLDSVEGNGRNYPAEVTATTPRRYLERHVYGDRTDDVLHARAFSDQIARGPLRSLVGNEVFEAANKPHAEIRFFGNDGGARNARGWLAYPHGPDTDPAFSAMAKAHEYAHALNQPESPTVYGDISQHFSPHRLDIRKALLDQGVNSTGAERIGNWSNHFENLTESMAQANVFKGLHYGVTGELPRNGSDFEGLVHGIVNSQHELNPAGTKTLDVFGEDPVMQYGPAAGQQAVYYKYLRFLLQHLISPDPKKATTDEIERGVELMRSSDANPQRAAGTA